LELTGRKYYGRANQEKTFNKNFYHPSLKQETNQITNIDKRKRKQGPSQILSR